MARRTVLPASLLAGQGIARRLADIQGEQAAIRPRRRHLFHGWEMSEFDALYKLVRSIFGDRGLIESGQEDPGLLFCGYFVDPPEVAPIGTERRRVFPFKGRTLAEVEKQIRAWRAHT